MEALFLSVLLGSPWLVAIAWAWAHAPRHEVVPPSMGEQALRRLEAA